MISSSRSSALLFVLAASALPALLSCRGQRPPVAALPIAVPPAVPIIFDLEAQPPSAMIEIPITTAVVNFRMTFSIE